MTTTTALRIATILILLGIVLMLIGQFHLTAGTFMAMAMVGYPCIGLGVLIYVGHVFRTLTKQGAL